MTRPIAEDGKAFEDVVVYSGGEAIVIGHIVHRGRGRKGWIAETPPGKLIAKGCTRDEAYAMVKRWANVHGGVLALDVWGWV
jgi:hypothetical protein